MGKLEAHALELLGTRARRLVFLIEQRAPLAMLATEARLIADAGSLLDPDAYLRQHVEIQRIMARTLIGICAHPDCDMDLEHDRHEVRRLCELHEREALDALRGEDAS